jgi:hypothetical protein
VPRGQRDGSLRPYSRISRPGDDNKNCVYYDEMIWIKLIIVFHTFMWVYLVRQVVGLERGTLSLVSTTEELLDRKVAAPV